MTSTSAEAYYAIPDLEDRQRRVYSCIAECPGVSSDDIARIRRMDPHNVCCRITELKNAGMIVSTGKKRDRRTGRTVSQYIVTEAPE